MIWENGQWREGNLNKYLENGKRKWIYEVVRIQEACPIFITEHLNRLWQGAANIKIPLLFKPSEITAGLFDLIDQEKYPFGNIRIQVDQKSGLTLMGFIPHHYPAYDDYQNGISVTLLQTERTNPNVKCWNPNVRRSADEHISKTDSYEAILVNQGGYLTEGSRSNLFGIKSGELFTPPLEQVLPGITRQVLLRLARENALPLKEARIHKTELGLFESFFVSGTSPGVLPVRKIEGNAFAPNNPITKQLSTLYTEAIKQNIDQTVRNFRNTQ